MNIKTYKINDWWGINCITGNGNMGLEVFMMQVPWHEVVESYYNIQSKDDANKMFKDLVAKYKQLG